MRRKFILWSPILLISAILACLFVMREERVDSGAPDIRALEEPVSSSKQKEAVESLIKRIIPYRADQIKVEIIPPDLSGQDVFEIEGLGDKVVLRGNTGVAVATALNHYLKYTCNAHVSWMGDQLSLPEILPHPKEKQRLLIEGKKRVYMNYCTASYSAAWWDWKRWEREIDFMAMNSINMPLFTTGLEAVWYNTLLRFRFTDEQARQFLVAPTHFAWQWMQNIQSVEGPLPKSWIDSHIDLGRKVIARELELGMTPIQQGFSGFVPRELGNKYPDAKIKRQGHWCGFLGAAQLDPTDPLFLELGTAFLQEQKKLFGAHGLYAADPFHESSPPDSSPDYLPSVGKAIYKLYKDFDPKAVWVMQTWSLYEPIIKSVPKEDLILLDLNGYTRGKGNFWEYPYVRGTLHNFGGRINMHGNLAFEANMPYLQAKKEAPNIIGSGLFMEGIEHNPVYFDMVFEQPLHNAPFDPKDWLDHYATRRYGASSDSAKQAWRMMLDKGPYTEGTNGLEKSSVICARPALNVKKSGPNDGFHIPYKPADLIEIQGLLLKDGDTLKSSSAYRFDVMDVQRQIQSNLGQAIHAEAAKAFAAKDKILFAKHSQRFLELLSDTDTLLRTRPEYNFDRYLTDARRWGKTEEEKNQYEKNASALVTAWSLDTDGPPHIFDYSWREWAGLISGYYRERWSRFYAMLTQCLDEGRDYVEEGLPQVYGRETWLANDFYKSLAAWEASFIYTPGKARIPVTEGDDYDTAKRLYAKYKTLAQEYYSPDDQILEEKKIKTHENLGEKE